MGEPTQVQIRRSLTQRQSLEMFAITQVHSPLGLPENLVEPEKVKEVNNLWIK